MNEMPLSEQDFPYLVQVAFFMYSLLSDRWDGMSGIFMGKDWSSAEFLLNIYEIDDTKEVVYIMKIWERSNVNYSYEQAEKRREAEERKNRPKNGPARIIK